MRVVLYRDGRVTDYFTGEKVDFEPAPSVVTVGSYDGVHAGHRRIIGKLVDTAAARGLRSVVVTFEPHPRQVVAADSQDPPRLLTLLEEKAMLIESLGVAWLFVVNFDSAFASQSSESFIDSVLIDLIGARRIVIGYDHGFGRNRKGGASTLRRLASKKGFSVDVVDEVRLQAEHFSSTRIRTFLLEGRIREANLFLGAPYMISGEVVHGAKRGRTIGFPTVNLRIGNPDKLLPKNGVYVASIFIEGREYRAMMNIGTRPTVSAKDGPSVEAHILDHEGELYGIKLTFYLLDRLRDEIRFRSIDDLRRQLQKDEKEAKQFHK